MALDTRTVMTSPIYWTAAIYQYEPSRGYVFKGYMPTVRATRGAFLEREMRLQESTPGKYTKTYPFYWDGRAWNREHQTSGFKMGAEPIAIGALERRSPLPPGRYWQDIFEKQARDWSAWVLPNIDAGTVKILKDEHFKADPLRDGSWLPDVLAPGSPGKIAERSWFLFEVLKPVDWPATKLGFPTIAHPEVKSSADTALNPPGPTPLDEIGEGLKDVLVPVATLGGLYLGIKLLLALRK